jgi:mannose-6-phosphate isomerase-like protein (cupin superfamily)
MDAQTVTGLQPILIQDEDVAYGRRARVSEEVKGPKVFQVRPKPQGAGRRVERLAGNDLMTVLLHVVASGGENNLHAHMAQDATWFVFQGEVTFYGEGNRIIAKLGPQEGIFIPRETPYWFQSSSQEELIMVRTSGRAQNIPNNRVDYAPRKGSFPSED